MSFNMTSSAVEGNGFVGHTRNQKATAYNTMPFTEWNKLIQKSNKIESPKKTVRR